MDNSTENQNIESQNSQVNSQSEILASQGNVQSDNLGSPKLESQGPQASLPEAKDKKSKHGSFIKPLLIGILGAIIGLAGGIGYVALSGGTGSLTTLGGAIISKSTASSSDSTTTAIKQVSNAVVSVLNYQNQSSSSNSVFGGNSASSSLELTSEGSGVIYKKSGDYAYIVTNDHVIAGESQLEVQLAGGQKVSASVVGSDTFSDLAVLKINAQYVKQVASFGDSSKLQVGQTTIAVGSPLGSTFANTATEGIVSALNRPVNMLNDSNQTISTPNAIQTDAAINPGNSGGALIDLQGQVIGITSSKLTTTEDGSTTVEGMGFAIPSDDVVSIISKLEKGETIQRPALGITSQYSLSDLSNSQLASLNLPSSVTSGVIVASVQSGFPAQVAGIQAGDVITKLGNTSVSSLTALQTELYKHSIGDTISITFYRGSQEKTVSVKLDQSSAKLSSN